MATIGLRQSAWQNATEEQRLVFRWVVLPHIGQPALYQTAGGVVYFVSDDHRLDMLNIARLGCLATKLAEIPPGFTDGLTFQEIRQMAIQYVQNHLVWPITVPEGTDPYQAALDAQGTPAWLVARAGVPSGLTPVQEQLL